MNSTIPQNRGKVVLIRGAGDIATGTARRLHVSGFAVVCTEIEKPLTVRRTVAFSEAVYESACEVEGVRAMLSRLEDAERILNEGKIPVLIDPDFRSKETLEPAAIVDARMLKSETYYHLEKTPVIIGLGPGFTAGRNCHAYVETLRGHDLGRVGYTGSAIPNTATPAERGSCSLERVLRAPVSGKFTASLSIGDKVSSGDVVAHIDGEPVITRISGYLRGLLHDGLDIQKNLKVGDVDPAAEYSHCFTISDRANAIAGGVLEALLHLL